jgi:hypothetical protein
LSRRKQIVITIVVLAVAIAAAVVWSPTRLAEWATILSGPAVVLGIVAVIARPRRPDTAQVNDAADMLLENFTSNLREDARERGILGVEQIPLSWQQIGGGVPPLPTGNHSRPLCDLPEWIGGNASEGVAVVADVGAGKTTVAILTVLKLADTTQQIARERIVPDMVPVLLNLSSWNPRKRHLITWAAAQLQRLVPELRDSYDSRVVRAVVTNRVLLLLDGLDELPADYQSEALEQIARAGLRHGFVVFSQKGPYVSARQHLAQPRFAIELEPLSATDAADYLSRDTAPAATAETMELAERLRQASTSPAADVLRTPLYLVLAKRSLRRRAFPVQPGDLPDVPAEELRSRLLGGVLTAAFPETPLRPEAGWRCKREQAERWLRTLARAINGGPISSRFAWWALPVVVPWPLQATLAGAITFAYLTPLLGMIGDAGDPPIFAVLAATAVAAASSSGPTFKRRIVLSRTGPRRASTVIACLITGNDLASGAGLGPSLRVGLLLGVMYWLALAGVAWTWNQATWYPRPALPREAGWELTKGKAVVALVAGVFLGLGTAIMPSGVRFDTTGSLPPPHITLATAGSAIAIAVTTTLLTLAALSFGRPSEPVSADDLARLIRSNVTFGCAAALLWVAAVLVPSMSVLLVHSSPEARAELNAIMHLHGHEVLGPVAAVAILYVLLGLVILPLGILITPGGRFLIASLILSVFGRWPLRPFRFLQLAHSRGVLRQTGWYYEFRPAQLQAYLLTGGRKADLGPVNTMITPSPGVDEAAG